VSTRPASVAGSFYPDDAAELRRYVRALLDAAPPAAVEAEAIIAPHAGYIYSGQIAASAFRCLRPLAGKVRRVAVVGPSHFVAFRGIALSGWSRFRTPLGELAVPDEARDALLGLGRVVTDDRPHGREHAIEVELPFVQLTLGEVELVPLVVGEATAAEVATAIEAITDGPGAITVISSDLSHCEPYGEATRHDQRTAEAIERLDEGAIGPLDACGWLAIGGLLRQARAQGLVARRLDLRNSGDTAGRRDSVVGYGAWAFAPAAAGGGGA
jgi:AmmeMemoRadiSam system protein B